MDQIAEHEKSNNQSTLQEITLDIHGMHCASCVLRVENALRAVNGVQDVNVNLISNTAKVKGTDQAIPQKLIEAVDKVGYDSSIHVSPLHKLNSLGQLPTAEPGMNANVAQKPPDSGQHADWDHEHSPHDAAPMEPSGHSHGNGSDFKPRGLIFPSAFSILGALMSLLWPQSVIIVPALTGLLAGIVIFKFGKKILISAWKSVLHFSPGMDSLIAAGTLAAFASGFFQLLKLKAGMSDFEVGSVIMTFQLIGRVLETKSRGSLASSVSGLLSQLPPYATRIKDGEEENIAVDELQIGDILVVRPGQSFAADGSVLSGKSHANEALVTGESMPVSKEAGDKVIQGSINGPGLLQVRVEKPGSGSTLALIAEAISNAQSSKIPLQRMADAIASWFVPSVFVAALAAIAIFLVRGAPAWDAITVGISVLVVACPCALGVAIPAAIAVASAKAADHGILYRDAASLESSANLSEILFDKTGTLTQGTPSLTDTILLNQGTPYDLQLASAAEYGSEHPIAIAIRTGITTDLKPDAGSFIAYGGKGVQAIIHGSSVLVGSPSLLEDQGISLSPESLSQAQALFASGKTVSFAAVDGRLCAILAIADELREEAPEAIRSLKSLGVKPALLTGDNQLAANAVALALGIEDIMAEASPNQKLEEITKRVNKKTSKQLVAMVGDGINDAPALALADVGIAMGQGTDAAIGAASVTLLRADLRAIPTMIRLSRATRIVIMQNLYWAFGYNALMLAFAMTGHLSPMFASGAMAISSLTVVLNAQRLRRFDHMPQ